MLLMAASRSGLLGLLNRTSLAYPQDLFCAMGHAGKKSLRNKGMIEFTDEALL